MKRSLVRILVLALAVCLIMSAAPLNTAMAAGSWKTASTWLKDNGSSGSSVKLKWTSTGTAASYYAVCEVIGNSAYVIKVVGSMSVTLKNMPAGTHRYAVFPCSSKNSGRVYGKNSNVVTVTIKSGSGSSGKSGWKNTAPVLKNNGSGGNTVKLKWTVSGSAAPYHAVCEVKNGSVQVIKVVSSMSVTLKDVKSGSHTYVVYPCSSKDDGRTYGKASNTVSIKVASSGSSSSSSSSSSATGGDLKTKLRKAIGSKSIYKYSEKDYDGDGKKEAFAIVSARVDSEGNPYNFQVWFVSGSTVKKCEDISLAAYKQSCGATTYSGKTCYYVQCGAYGSGWWNHYWTVKNGQPVEIAEFNDNIHNYTGWNY